MVTIDNVPYSIDPSQNAFEEIVLPESVERDLAQLPDGETQSEYHTFLTIIIFWKDLSFCGAPVFNSCKKEINPSEGNTAF